MTTLSRRIFIIGNTGLVRSNINDGTTNINLDSTTIVADDTWNIKIKNISSLSFYSLFLWVTFKLK